MIKGFLLLAGEKELTRTCVDCGWQESPDGEPEKLFCPECDCENFVEVEGE